MSLYNERAGGSQQSHRCGRPSLSSSSLPSLQFVAVRLQHRRSHLRRLDPSPSPVAAADRRRLDPARRSWLRRDGGQHAAADSAVATAPRDRRTSAQHGYDLSPAADTRRLPAEQFHCRSVLQFSAFFAPRNNKWSKQFGIRQYRRRARIVHSYSPGGANMLDFLHRFVGPTRVCSLNVMAIDAVVLHSTKHLRVLNLPGFFTFCIICGIVKFMLLCSPSVTQPVPLLD